MTALAQHVVIVGGGLAGLAAATALATRGMRVTLLEARRRLGGRAGSYADRETGELIDHCQHVAMGCCTNYLDFCRRVGIDHLFERHETLHFFGPDGRRSDFRPSKWLPAPLHLLPGLSGLRHLSSAARRAIRRAMLRLTRETDEDSPGSSTMLEWLRLNQQPDDAIELFWAVVLVSALGDTLDRVSVPASRKVFVDGFMAARGASDVLVPTVSLGELYEVQAAKRLRDQGVQIRLESAADLIRVQRGGAHGVTLSGGETLEADSIVVSVPWRQAARLFQAPSELLPELAGASGMKPSPITGVHLWLDRPIMDLPHAVVVGRLSQWVFARSGSVADRSTGAGGEALGSHYYQIVISGSHDLAGRERESILNEVLGDLRAIWPHARDSQVLRAKIITERESVFSMQPGIEALRPSQRTNVPGLFLAGDWTRTGWPATMEGAVRSGYLAAEGILADAGRPEKLLVPDLAPGWLARAILPRAHSK